MTSDNERLRQVAIFPCWVFAKFIIIFVPSHPWHGRSLRRFAANSTSLNVTFGVNFWISLTIVVLLALRIAT